MKKPATNIAINSNTTTPTDTNNSGIDRKTPTGGGSAGGGVLGAGLGTLGGAVASSAPKFADSNACPGDGRSAGCIGASPSNVGTMISPAHFVQRITVPALRVAMLIN
jgi:hypothetical protein